MKLLSNKGFTLIEMLMILTVVTLVLYISSMNFLKTKDGVSLVQDVQLLGQTYQALQLKSLSLNKETSLKVREDGFSCFIEGLKKEVCNYYYNDTYELNTNFLNDTIYINNDGNVIIGGTITYKYKGFEKKIVISIGSGRYEIK